MFVKYVLSLFLALLCLGHVHAVKVLLYTQLNGANVRPDPVVTSAEGLAAIYVDTTASSLRGYIVHTLPQPVGSSFNTPSPAGLAFDAVYLFPNANSAVTSPEVSLRPETIQAALSGMSYVTVRDEPNQHGAIRGQLKPITCDAGLPVAAEGSAVFGHFLLVGWLDSSSCTLHFHFMHDMSPATVTAARLSAGGTSVAVDATSNELQSIQSTALCQALQAGQSVTVTLDTQDNGAVTSRVTRYDCLGSTPNITQPDTPIPDDQPAPQLPSDVVHLFAVMDGGSVRPHPVDTAALGLASMCVKVADNSFRARIVHTFYMPVGASINAPATVEADHEPIYLFRSAWTPIREGFISPFNRSMMAHVLAEESYVQVRDGPNNHGAIRGQLVLTPMYPFVVDVLPIGGTAWNHALTLGWFNWTMCELMGYFMHDVVDGEVTRAYMRLNKLSTGQILEDIPLPVSSRPLNTFSVRLNATVCRAVRANLTDTALDVLVQTRASPEAAMYGRGLIGPCTVTPPSAAPPDSGKPPTPNPSNSAATHGHVVLSSMMWALIVMYLLHQ